MAHSLLGSAGPLCRFHDVALLDLDGVVYVGPDAVPGAPAALARAREAGMRLAFVTNNAARPPYAVADHLTSLGVQAAATEVITSAQAASHYLADHLPGGARVLVVGTTGLEVALRERGLTPVSDAAGRVDAVVQGYSAELSWAQLAEGAVAINRGVLWVATNIDPTVPSPRGPLPGNGSLVAALEHATGRRPIVTGKPDPTMHRETLTRTAAERPIVVGDRLDTDIEGANAVGCPSLLVLSGVTTPSELLLAPAHQRPSYLGADVSSLLEEHQAPTGSGDGFTCGRWSARLVNGTLEASSLDRAGTGSNNGAQAGDGSAAGTGTPPRREEGAPSAHTDLGTDDTQDTDELDLLRALCAAAWSAGDEVVLKAPGGSGTGDGASAGGAGVTVRNRGGRDTADVLTRLRLAG